MAYELPTTDFKHLVSGRRYAVVRAFRDFDQGEHLVGEEWTFIGHSFLPYDDGLSLFVEVGDQQRHIRMQWRDEEQGPIIDRLQDYVQEVR
jgi:hypothetical protein